MITDAHNTRYCSPIGRSTAPARIPIVRLYDVSRHGQGGGGQFTTAWSQAQTKNATLPFPPALITRIFFPSPAITGPRFTTPPIRVRDRRHSEEESD